MAMKPLSYSFFTRNFKNQSRIRFFEKLNLLFFITLLMHILSYDCFIVKFIVY